MSSSALTARVGLSIDSSLSASSAARARPAALVPRQSAPRSPGYLADMSLFQRVQTECATLGDHECVRRFRALYKGKEKYSDEALKLQFNALGVYMPAGSAARRTDDQKGADDCHLSRSSSQQPVPEEKTTTVRPERVVVDAVVLDNSDSDGDDDCNQDKQAEEARLTYEPLSPVADSPPLLSLPSSMVCPASLDNVSVMNVRTSEDKWNDDSIAPRLHEAGASTADTGVAGIQPDSALVEAVVAALAVRKTNRTAAKRRREDEERQAARQKWKQQCRDRAGAVGRTVYRGITAMACSYGLAQAIAAVYPSEVEQAATFAQQQFTTFMGHL